MTFVTIRVRYYDMEQQREVRFDKTLSRVPCHGEKVRHESRRYLIGTVEFADDYDRHRGIDAFCSAGFYGEVDPEDTTAEG